MSIVLLCFILLLLNLISYSDIKHRRISNYQLSVLTVTIILYCFSEEALNQVWWSLPVLAIGFLLWMLGYWGGGDAKLLAILAPAIHPEFYCQVLIIVLIVGGVLALFISKLLNGILKLGVTNSVPYAVPISIGGVLGILASFG